MADFVQGTVAVQDRTVDPCLRALGPELSAAMHHSFKGRVDPHLEPVLPHHFGERTGNVEPVERHNAPAFGLHPEDFQIVRIFSHGKDPTRIGAQQQIGCQQGHTWMISQTRKMQNAPLAGSRDINIFALGIKRGRIAA